jgi:hypothetical protein
VSVTALQPACVNRRVVFPSFASKSNEIVVLIHSSVEMTICQTTLLLGNNSETSISFLNVPKVKIFTKPASGLAMVCLAH